MKRITLFFYLAVLLLCSCKNTSRQQTSIKTSSSENPEISDTQLLDTLQYQTFNYFWEGADPTSGLAYERIHMDSIYPNHSKEIITTGGSGFGLMAIIAGIERGYITREDGLKRFQKIVAFLGKADRFHGAWSHWMMPSGKMTPFSAKDNGGDLVETAFLVQGLLTAYEYFKDGNEAEQQLANRIDELWRGVEWDWYTKNGENVLYWHWSPEYEWEMDFPVGGYNEALIMYVLAAASPTHPITPEVYHSGWAGDGEIAKDTTYYDLRSVLNYYEHSDAPTGPLFWSHYSYLGLNPNGLKDTYADYGELTKNHALMHYRHSQKNPNNFKGYGDSLWGLTSSYSIKGYAGHRPDEDLGVISPTAAFSSFPYTPKESMQMLRYLYTKHDSLIGKYGPYDAFSFQENWYLPRYLAIDQGPIPVMIENYRSGLLWKLFMNNKDVQNGLKTLGFTSKALQTENDENN